MKNCFLPLILFFTIIFFSDPVYSQQLIPIKGFVFNIETNEPVVNANILVVNTSLGTTSDRHGNFELRLANGEYKIKITSVGFTGKEIPVHVLSGNNEFMQIAMEPKKQELERVDVFGNYSIVSRDTSINKVPTSILPAISFVTAAEIEKQGAVTITDALKYVPGGWTETRGRKSKQFFSVRGQKYPYPDYSIDGVWQKEFEETAYVLSALDIESVEVVRSSNALVKGLSGLTGVVEIKTKQPDHESISLLTKYGEYNNYLTNLQYGNKINDVSFSASTSFFGTNGIPDRRGKERIANFHGNMDWELSKKLTLSIGATYISGLREFVSIVEPGAPNILNQEEKFDPIHSWITYAKLNFRGNDQSQTEIQTNYTFRNTEYQSFNITKQTSSSHFDKDWEYGVNILHSRSLTSSNTFRIGALYNHWVAPDGKRYYAGRRCDLHTYSGVIADEQKLGRFLLDAGFRIIGGYIEEWGGFGIEGSASGFQNVAPIIDQSAPLEWQSALGGSYVVSNVSSLHYHFSAGTIAPRKGSLDENGMIPEIETRLQHDLGFRIKTQNQNEITVSTFYTKRNSAIELSGKTVTSQDDMIVELYENVNKRSYGIELASNIPVPLLNSSVFANSTLMKNEKEVNGIMTDDEQLPNVIINAGILYEQSGFDASIFINYIGPYSNNRFVNPGWVIENGNYPLGDFVSADLTAGYTFRRKVLTRIFIEIKNILDKKYETVACYPDVGRIFQAGVKLNY